MVQIFIGILLLAAGVFFVTRTEWFINNFGSIAWFEANLGTEGGSRLGYKLIGVVIIFLGVVLATGSGDNFLEWLLAPLMKYNR